MRSFVVPTALSGFLSFLVVVFIFSLFVCLFVCLFVVSREAQYEKVDKLFKRQLAVPLIGESTLS